MREIVCLSVPAVLMILLVRLFTKRKMGLSEGILSFIIFMVMNAACVITVLGPFKKVVLILGEHGEMTLYYGGTAILTSIAIAVGLSVLISLLYRNIQITVRVEEDKGEKND